jgi:hypothetical protein
MPRAGHYAAAPTKLHHAGMDGKAGTASGGRFSASRPQNDRFGRRAQSCGAISISSAPSNSRLQPSPTQYLKLIRMAPDVAKALQNLILARLIAGSAGTQEEIEIAANVVRTTAGSQAARV